MKEKFEAVFEVSSQFHKLSYPLISNISGLALYATIIGQRCLVIIPTVWHILVMYLLAKLVSL